MKIEILGASAPVWGNEEKTVINLQVRFSHLDGEVPFTADRTDQAEHGRELWSRAAFLEFGPIGPYTGPTKHELEMATFPARKAKAMATAEQRITLLERVKRLKVADQEELEELEALELYTVQLMRAEGPEVPAFSFAH